MNDTLFNRRTVLLSAGIASLAAFLAGCGNSPKGGASAPARDASLLPAADPDPESQFFVDSNVNVDTIDGYLDLEGVVYRDMRLFDDPARYEAIGGNSKLAMMIRGFKVVPYPWIGTLDELPVEGKYDGPRLFDVEWGENLAVRSAKANYTQSMQVLEELFPKDKAIILMCGGGGYAGMMRQLLIHLGWDAEKLYNIGGEWAYGGDNLVQLISYADPDRPEYYLWRADIADIDFGLLYPAG